MKNRSWTMFKTKLFIRNSCIKSLLMILTMITLGSPAFAATYYMATTGSNSSSGTESAPWLTLVYSMSRMSGGDTLIIKNGTYTGVNNAISAGGTMPPVGSSSSWTTIKAQNDGGVLFDGENARDMFSVTGGNPGTNRYWQFEGLIWGRTSGCNVLCYSANYVKFLRCGAYDCGSGNNANFAMGRYGAYILVEGCYAWGAGRYKFLGYQGDYLIFRNCVARSDIINASTEPCAQFSLYSCDYSLAQNCIAIDSDQTSHYTAAEYHGPFIVPSTDMNANNTSFVNCIGLNIKTGGLCTTGNEYYAAKNTTFTNCVVWDCTPGVGIYNNWMRGNGDVINHCTFGAGAANSSTSYFHSYDGIGTNNNTVVKNSLFYKILGSGYSVLNDVESNSYNAYYANTAANNNSGTNDKTTTNFIWSSSNTSGGLKYITRIETGSNLSGQGNDGGDMGANVKTLVGKSGTLYGETGYNSDTGLSMWPFPNESLIKTKMAAYSNSGVSGARGFCTGTSKDGTTQTLTKYIWEYLGNQLPSDIYGSANIAKPTGVKAVVISD
ncbi:MAG: hypothetical protein ABFD81_11225 [Syntrophaceae bacterium]